MRMKIHVYIYMYVLNVLSTLYIYCNENEALYVLSGVGIKTAVRERGGWRNRIIRKNIKKRAKKRKDVLTLWRWLNSVVDIVDSEVKGRL